MILLPISDGDGVPKLRRLVDSLPMALWSNGLAVGEYEAGGAPILLTPRVSFPEKGEPADPLLLRGVGDLA